MVDEIRIDDETYWRIADECAEGKTEALLKWIANNDPNKWIHEGEPIFEILHTIPCYQCAIDFGLNINILDKYGANCLSRLSSDRETPEKLALVEFICAKGGDPNNKDEGGVTPTHSAIRFGNLKELEIYVKYGGDINIVDNDGRNGLFFNNSLNSTKYKRSEILEFLLKIGANIHQKSSSSGWTVLMSYIFTGSKEEIKILLSAGASPLEYSDPKPNFPKENSIDVARRLGKEDICRLLEAAA